MLRLPGQTEENCQLGKEEARHLETWSVNLRRMRVIGVPSRNGRSESLSSQNFAGIAASFAYKYSTSIPDGLPALVQMLQTESEGSRKLLVEELRKVENSATTTALARQAIFDLSAGVRQAAVEALNSRPKDQFRQVLLGGLRYPWPRIADHAAEALVALNDRDAVPMLRSLVDEADPALPVVKPGTGKLPQVTELVRINHFRNCLLCHPVSTKQDDRVRGMVPTPGKALPEAYYADRSRQGTIFVRADITYLRQDFSVLQRVPNATPWPEMQRFDFVLSSRDATPEELAPLVKKEKSETYPQRDVVQWALRELTR